jgi:hypothetical protein
MHGRRKEMNMKDVLKRKKNALIMKKRFCEQKKMWMKKEFWTH